MSETQLKYIGHGEYIVGIPARDLTDSDLTEIATKSEYSTDETKKVLIASGLYEPCKKRKSKSFNKTDEVVKNDNSTESI